MLIWFPIYWIVGGVFFAVYSLTHASKIRKARFSCLFTLACLIVAYGAAQTGLRHGHAAIDECLVKAQDHFEALAAVFACGAISIFAAAGGGLVVLLAIGFILHYISRAKNQSWVDSDAEIQEEVEVSFDNV